MASGAFTITTGSVRSAGNMFRASGTVEVDTTAGTAAIFPNGYIVSFSIDHNVDTLVTAVPRVHTNSSDFDATVANGSVHIDGNAGAPDTFGWTADFIM
jgi:hypothetical protein|tara:strand:+ start:1191 stop:1487 length:297 start_codon:yes stop_codon:yes gene_type:complete